MGDILSMGDMREDVLHSPCLNYVTPVRLGPRPLIWVFFLFDHLVWVSGGLSGLDGQVHSLGVLTSWPHGGRGYIWLLSTIMPFHP